MLHREAEIVMAPMPENYALVKERMGQREGKDRYPGIKGGSKSSLRGNSVNFRVEAQDKQTKISKRESNRSFKKTDGDLRNLQRGECARARVGGTCEFSKRNCEQVRKTSVPATPPPLSQENCFEDLS